MTRQRPDIVYIKGTSSKQTGPPNTITWPYNPNCRVHIHTQHIYQQQQQKKKLHQNQTWYIQPPNGSHQNPRVASQTAYNNHCHHKRSNVLLKLKSTRSFSYPLAQLVKKLTKDIHQIAIHYLTYLILNKHKTIGEAKANLPSIHRHILPNTNITLTYNPPTTR